MGAAETTMEARLAAIMASLSESRELLASTLRRLEVKEPEGQVATTTRLMFGQDRVREKTETKPLSSSLISTHRDLAVGALRVDTILAPTMPTNCSAEGLAHCTDNGHAELVFPTSGSTHLPAAISTHARNNTLQGMGVAGVDTPTCCSTHVLSWPRYAPGAHTRDVDTDMSAEVVTHVGSLSLFQELALESVHEVSNGIRFKDVVWDEEFADCIVTHIGGSSLFLEHVMGTNEELEGKVNKGRNLDSAVCVVGLVSLVKVKLQQPLSRERKQHGTNILTLLLPWDRGKQGKRKAVIHHLCWLLPHARNSTVPSLPWNRSVFNLWLGQNTPPDIMQLSLVCLSTKYIQDARMFLLLATMKQCSNDLYQVKRMLDNLLVMCFSEQNIVTLQFTCFHRYILAGSADDYSMYHLKFELLVQEYKDRNVEIISTGEQESTVILEMDKLGRTEDMFILKFRAQLLTSGDLQTKNQLISQTWYILDSTTSQTWLYFLLQHLVMKLATRIWDPGYVFLADSSLIKGTAVWTLFFWQWMVGVLLLRPWDPGDSCPCMSGGPWLGCKLLWFGSSDEWPSLHWENRQMIMLDARGMHNRDLGSSRVSRGGKCNTRIILGMFALEAMGWATDGLGPRPSLVTTKQRSSSSEEGDRTDMD